MDEQIPDDFPRIERLAAVPGARPKLLVRMVLNQYFIGETEGERLLRFQRCELVAEELKEVGETLEKRYPSASRQELIMRLAEGLRCERIVLPEEETWTIERAAQLLGWLFAWRKSPDT